MYACRRSVEAAESEIEFEVPLRLHRCCIAVDEESGVDLQCLSVLLKAMDGMKAVKREKEELSWRREASWRTRERDAFVKVFKIEGADFDGGGWRRVRQDPVQQESRCGRVRSAIRNCGWR